MVRTSSKILYYLWYRFVSPTGAHKVCYTLVLSVAAFMSCTINHDYVICLGLQKFSPDGRFIATADRDFKIRVWFLFFALTASMEHNFRLILLSVAINFVGYIIPKESSKGGPQNTELLPWAYRVRVVYNAIVYRFILFLGSFNIHRNLRYRVCVVRNAIIYSSIFYIESFRA